LPFRFPLVLCAQAARLDRRMLNLFPRQRGREVLGLPCPSSGPASQSFSASPGM
jgi:hypothetical protein